MHTRPYVFYFPSRDVGGVPVLFLRMAEHLALLDKNPIYIIDFPDGYMAQNIKNPKITLLPYSPSASLAVPKNSILIFQSDLPWGLPNNLSCDDSTTAFFWNCFPFNLIPVLPGKGRIWMSKTLCRTKLMLNTFLFPAKLKTQRFLDLLENKQAIAYMDGANLRFTEKALNRTRKWHDFLPIPLPSTTKRIKSTQTNYPLNFYWIGRIADFKVSSLIFALQKTAIWSNKVSKNVIFRIIGSGDHMPQLEEATKGLKGVHVQMMGNLSLDEIENRLINDADILFGMGTAALEGAKLGVPTILLDFSYDKFPDNYKGQWLYNTDQFTLGEQVDTLEAGLRSEFEDLFKEVLSKKGQISEECLAYFEKNHALETIALKFIQLSQQSTFVYSEFLKSTLIKKPLYYSLWNFFKNIFRS